MLAMDANFSQEPHYIPSIPAKAEEYDEVIGSRFIGGV
jgi:hypothetical protein